jgi:hypothetical protein
MPDPDFKIDRFAFISLSAPPEYPAAQVEIESRAGQDGSALWHLGVRGMPFQMESIVEAPTVSHAAVLLRLYRQLIAGDPVDMVWGGFEVEGVTYSVLAVEPAQRGIQAVLFGKGGVSGPASVSLGVCRCVWTLLPRQAVVL